MNNFYLEKILLPLGDRILGTSFIKDLKKWREISLMSETQLKELQRTKLQKLLDHARKNSPYYSKLGGENRFKDPIEKLKAYPILKKTDLKLNNKEMLTNHSGLIEYASSGSTGIQSVSFLSKSEESNIRAILIMWWEWAGYEFGDFVFQTGMTPNRGIIKKFKDILLNTKYFSAFNLNDVKVIESLQSIPFKKKKLIAGYPSSLSAIAEIALKNEIKIEFTSGISWGDKLFDLHRINIKKAFSCEVYDTYACNEGLMIAAQADLDYYYIMSPHLYLEILDENDQPVNDGEIGRVVITSLDHFTMPLIRYANGDLAIKLPKNEYPKNRRFNFPLLKKVVGRETDIILTPKGNKLIVHFFTGIFEFYPEIRQFQIYQEVINEFVVRYIGENSLSSNLFENLSKDMTEKSGEKLNISFIEVNEILPSPSGKPQIIETHLSKQE